jgi:hypothetical protein
MRVLQFAAILAAISYARARALSGASASISAGGGHIYALSLNGTTNTPNLLAADLTTYEIRAGPPLTDVELVIGQACVLDGAGATLFAFGITRDAAGEMFALLAVDTQSGALLRATNTSAWPGAAGKRVFVEAAFLDGKGTGLLVLARPLGLGQIVLRVDAATGAATLVGAVNISDATDVAYDAARDLLFAIIPGANDDESGTLMTIALAPTPHVTRSVALANHFGFPQVLPSGELIGLTLAEAPDGGYARNLTRVDADTGVETSEAQLSGGFYVVLEDGPKAIDAAGARAFYMLANSPFGEFDVVEVDVATGNVGESVGLCGFVGYCPEAFAFSAV